MIRVEAGRVRVASLEFFLSDSCNLRCALCAASSPFLAGAPLPDLEEFEASLDLLSRVMAADQIKFLGGEPLLNPRARDFLAAARRSGMFGRVRLVTNGVLLDRAPDELWRLADVIEVSRYPGSGPALARSRLERLRRKSRLFGARLEVAEKREFREAVLDVPNPHPAVVRRIHSECLEARPRGPHGPCHELHGSRLYRCSRTRTLDLYLRKTGVPHAAFAELDGLAVDGRLSARRLKRYLESPKPLRACVFCLGTSGRPVAHRMLGPGEPRDRGPGSRRKAFHPGLLGSVEGGRRALWYHDNGGHVR